MSSVPAPGLRAGAAPGGRSASAARGAGGRGLRAGQRASADQRVAEEPERAGGSEQPVLVVAGPDARERTGRGRHVGGRVGGGRAVRGWDARSRGVRSRVGGSAAVRGQPGRGPARRDGRCWGRAGSGRAVAGRSRGLGLRPAVGGQHVGQRQAARPALPFQAGRGRALVRPAQAQPAQGLHAVGQVQQRGQLGRLEQRHPAQAQAVPARGEPDVLDRAGTRPHVGVREGGTAQYPGRPGPAVAAHHHADRRLADPLELQAAQVPGTVGVELAGLRQPGPVGHHRGAGPQLRIPDHDEPPGLGVADARRGVPGRQHAGHELVADRVGAEPAHVPAGGDHLGQGRADGLGQRPARRVAGPLGAGCRIPDQGPRPRPVRRCLGSHGLTEPARRPRGPSSWPAAPAGLGGGGARPRRSRADRPG